MNIQEKSKEFFGSSCYAYSLAYLFTESMDWPGLTESVVKGLTSNYIDLDGFVSKPLEYVKLISGRKYRDVRKVRIDNLSELPAGLFPVQFVLGNTSHFVVADRNGVVFDPYENSKTVREGKPISYRLFIE